MIKVVIIDSGISADNHTKHVNCLSGIGIKRENGRIVYLDNYQDDIGHGTIVYNILSKYLETSVEIFTIKIFDNSITCDPELLSAALKYCYENIECNIIQISLGSLYSDSNLHDIIIKLSHKGVCLVSAFDNEAALSYPAAYEEVIGVDINHDYKKIDHYDVVENNIIDIRGADIFYRTSGLQNKSIIVRGSSFYCSYIVAKIANEKLFLDDKRAIIEYFKCNARKSYSSDTSQEISKSLFINRAIVFPFNKEIHSIAAFEDLVNFEIIDYYDIRQKGLVNRQILDIIPYSKNHHVIKNFDEIDWKGDFDTFICGHSREISKLLNVDVLGYIVKQCVLYRKKLVCFDDISDHVYQNPQLLAWFPATHPSLVPAYRFGKLRSPCVPTVGVFGTSSCQGKMTVQLTLRRALLKAGIKVCNIGSEPESTLFGFDYSYAFGYDACDSFNPEEMILALNEAVYDLENSKCEIIIAGSQSGTVPHQLRNINMIPLKQYFFLLGIQPDSIILCVNSFDDFEYIERTIAFFQATVKAKVLCLVVSDIAGKKTISSKNIIDNFKNHFCMPVMTLKNLNDDVLVQLLKDYYEV